MDTWEQYGMFNTYEAGLVMPAQYTNQLLLSKIKASTRGGYKLL
jgi:hypothetical protein